MSPASPGLLAHVIVINIDHIAMNLILKTYLSVKF